MSKKRLLKSIKASSSRAKRNCKSQECKNNIDVVTDFCIRDVKGNGVLSRKLKSMM